MNERECASLLVLSVSISRPREGTSEDGDDFILPEVVDVPIYLGSGEGCILLHQTLRIVQWRAP